MHLAVIHGVVHILHAVGEKVHILLRAQQVNEQGHVLGILAGDGNLEGRVLIGSLVLVLLGLKEVFRRVGFRHNLAQVGQVLIHGGAAGAAPEHVVAALEQHVVGGGAGENVLGDQAGLVPLMVQIAQLLEFFGVEDGHDLAGILVDPQTGGQIGQVALANAAQDEGGQDVVHGGVHLGMHGMHLLNEGLQILQGFHGGHAHLIHQILPDADGAEGIGGRLVAEGNGVHAAVREGEAQQGVGVGHGAVVGHVLLNQAADVHDVALGVALAGPVGIGQGRVEILSAAGQDHTVGHVARAVFTPGNVLHVDDAVDFLQENLSELILQQFLHAGSLVAVKEDGDFTRLFRHQGRIDDVGGRGRDRHQQRQGQDDGCQTLEHGKTSLLYCFSGMSAAKYLMECPDPKGFTLSPRQQ